MNNMTRKQRIELALLAVVTAVLFTVLYFRFFYNPLTAECSALENSIGEKEFQLSSAKADIMRLEAVSAHNARLYDSISAETSQLLPIMSVEEADGIITGYILSAGLTPEALTAEFIHNDDSGVCVITADYQLSGSYKRLTSLIAAIENHTGMCIDSLRINASRAEGSPVRCEDNITADITISVYMHTEN